MRRVLAEVGSSTVRAGARTAAVRGLHARTTLLSFGLRSGLTGDHDGYTVDQEILGPVKGSEDGCRRGDHFGIVRGRRSARGRINEGIQHDGVADAIDVRVFACLVASRVVVVDECRGGASSR